MRRACGRREFNWKALPTTAWSIIEAAKERVAADTGGRLAKFMRALDLDALLNEQLR